MLVVGFSPGNSFEIVNAQSVTANGKPVEAKLPCSLEEFLVAQKLLPRGKACRKNQMRLSSIHDCSS